jgi:peptidoglycan/LPS O-acetylase OafA/YrhL
MFRGFGVGVINGSLWTIPVEVGFYILLPWYYSMFRMNASRTSGNLALWGSILLFGLVSVLVSVAEGQADIVIKIIRVTPVPHLYLFLLGVLLQRNEHFVKRYLAGKAVIWWVSYLLLMYGVEAGFGLEVSASPLFVLPSRVILGCVAIAFCFSWIELSSKLLGQLDLSYGIYLYHMLVVNSLLQVGYAGKFSGLIISFSLSIVLAWISWVVIEAPCLRLKHLTAVPSLKNSALFK